MQRRQSLVDCPVETGGECTVPDRRKKLHFDWGVNIPTVIAVITMLTGAVAYIIRQDQRQTRTETRVDGHDTTIKELKGDLKGDVQRVDNNVLRVESKLDRLIENNRR